MAAIVSIVPRVRPCTQYSLPRVRAKIIIKILLTELLNAGRPKMLFAFKSWVYREARLAKIIHGRMIRQSSTVSSLVAPVKPGATSLTRRGAPMIPITEVSRKKRITRAITVLNNFQASRFSPLETYSVKTGTITVANAPQTTVNNIFGAFKDIW